MFCILITIVFSHLTLPVMTILISTTYFINERILVVAAFFVVCKVLSLLQKCHKGAMVQDLVDLVATVHLQRFDATFHEFALE